MSKTIPTSAPVMKELTEMVLERLDGKVNDEAAQLVLGTLAVESDFRYVRQMGYDPIFSPIQEEETASLGGAFGYSQVEVATARDMLTNWHRMNKLDGQHYQNFRFFLGNDLVLNDNQFIMPSKVSLAYALQERAEFSIAMCRLAYKRKPGAIPEGWEAKAEYWKQHYNTELGAGTPGKFMAAISKHDLPGLWE
jgi:hypothetical protein|tara:strand:- start:10608 stop:11189 length:582 start_codon:yes stop_codon:yes gene_type:complete